MLLDHHPIAVLLAFVLLAAGGGLLLRARSVSDDQSPHCLLCGYNLTGRGSDRCPECGTILTEDTLSEGPPTHMRWGVFLSGMVLLATGIAIVAVLAIQ